MNRQDARRKAESISKDELDKILSSVPEDDLRLPSSVNRTPGFTKGHARAILQAGLNAVGARYHKPERFNNIATNILREFA